MRHTYDPNLYDKQALRKAVRETLKASERRQAWHDAFKMLLALSGLATVLYVLAYGCAILGVF